MTHTQGDYKDVDLTYQGEIPSDSLPHVQRVISHPNVQRTENRETENRGRIQNSKEATAQHPSQTHEPKAMGAKRDPPSVHITDGELEKPPSVHTESIDPPSVHYTLCTSIKKAVSIALAQRGPDSAVWKLVRALKTLKPDMTETEKGAAFKLWYGYASEKFQIDSFDSCELEFLGKWNEVRFKLGEDPVQEAFEAAKNAIPPAIANRFSDAAIRLLVTLCRELQRRQGNAPFFLSCHQAAKLFGHKTHTVAYGWLNGLVAKGILQITQKGTPGPAGRSTRYRYLHPLEDAP